MVQQIQLPSGEIVGFPDGTPQPVMEKALREYTKSSTPKMMSKNPVVGDVVRGAAGTLGLPAMLANAPADLARFGIKAFGGKVTPEMKSARVPLEYSDIMGAIESKFGKAPEHETKLGKIAGTAIEAGVSPAKGIAGLIGNLASGGVSELAGQITEGSPLEPVARILGALGGGKASSTVTGSPFKGAARNRAEETLERAAGDTTLQEVQQGVKTADRAKQFGVPLTTGEATGSPALMATTGTVKRDTNTTKFVEDFMEKRRQSLPESEKQFVRNTIADIDVEDADIAGQALIKEADAYTESLKKLRSESASPLYKQAFFNGDEPVRVSSKEFNNLLKDRNVLLRIKDVQASDPALSKLPINSIAVLDKVKSEFFKDARKGMDANQSRIFNNYGREIESSITKTLGNSPRADAYKKARQIWADDSDEINRAIETEVGAIQNIKPLKEADVGAKLLDMTPKQIQSIADKLPEGAVRKAASASMQQIINEKSGKTVKNIRQLFFDNINDQKKVGVLVKDDEALKAWEDFSDILSRTEKQAATMAGSNTIDKLAGNEATKRAITGAAVDLTTGGKLFSTALNLVQRIGGSGNLKPLSPKEAENLAKLLINSDEGLKTLERLKTNPARRDLQKIQAFVDTYRATIQSEGE